MARSTTLNLTAQTVTELTNAENATGTVVYQNKGIGVLYVLATTDATEPTKAEMVSEGIAYAHGEGERDTIANIFPDLTTPVRLWAFCFQAGRALIRYA